jgi:uncharacterized protein YceH (UPF0502 family)
MPALELDPIEARILGVLIEKETTTPEQYPLSLHALAAGCNQKSNRDPVLELSESEVSAGIEHLRRKSLVGAAHASGARVEKYKHAAGAVWQLSPGELAVMAELLLRGAQMPGELRSRADRMSRFETLEALAATLEGLRAKGFVRRLEPLPGARAPQWEQIVAQRAGAPAPATTGTVARAPIAEGAYPIPRSPEPVANPAGRGSPTPSALEARVAALEAEVARLGSLYESLAGSRR